MINGTTYSYSASGGSVTAAVGDTITLNVCGSCQMYIQNSSNETYIPNTSNLPITFTMPDEDLSFTSWASGEPT